MKLLIQRLRGGIPIRGQCRRRVAAIQQENTVHRMILYASPIAEPQRLFMVILVDIHADHAVRRAMRREQCQALPLCRKRADVRGVTQRRGIGGIEVRRFCWLFDVSCGFEYGTCRAGDHIDHGGEGLRVSVSTGTRSGGLEKTVQSFHAGIGIG